MKIANLFTGLRIVLLVPLFWLLWRGPGWGALAVYLLAGVTDVADGWLARRLNQTSRFGAFFDKLADRLLTITVAVGLIAFRPQPWPVVVACLILVMRDAVVASLNEFLPGKLDITVSTVEKVKITLNWLGFGLLMSPDLLLPWGMSHALGVILLAASALVCLTTLMDYGRRAYKVMKAET